MGKKKDRKKAEQARSESADRAASLSDAEVVSASAHIVMGWGLGLAVVVTNPLTGDDVTQPFAAALKREAERRGLMAEVEAAALDLGRRWLGRGMVAPPKYDA